MSIVASELKTYKSAVVDDTSSNGGIMSAVEVISNAGQNVFPHVFRDERLIGSETYRKLFDKVGNADSDTLFNAKYFFDGPTLGDDWAIFFAGTQRDTEANMVETPTFGSGFTTQNITAGLKEVKVNVKDTSLIGIFGVGDTVRITDKANILAAGNEEFHVIANASAVGSTVTFDIVGVFANSYTLGVTKVSSVYEPGDIVTSVDNWAENGSGTYDETTYPVALNNLGAVEDTWTLTFTSATEFNVIGLYRGSVGSGEIGIDFSPSNADFSQPLFTLLTAGWGGTWTINDTIVFQTHPASVPLWEKRVVPAGCTPLSNNKIVKIASGEAV